MSRVESTGGAVNVLLKLVFQPTFIAGVVCFGLGLLAYSIVLSKMNLSIAYPIIVTMSLILVYFAMICNFGHSMFEIVARITTLLQIVRLSEICCYET